METLGLSESDRAAVARFEAEVLQPSLDQLVILQFTAEWCGPCKQLSPILEQVAAEYAERGVVLKKVDVDADAFIAAQFRVQSVPTVYALFQGQPVADLGPYRTPASLGQALDQLLAQLPISGAAQDREEALAPLLAEAMAALDGGEADRALAQLGALHDRAPANPAIVGALARAMLATGRRDEARALLDGVDEKTAKDPAIARARAALEVSEAGEDAVDTSAYVARLEADPDDHAARFELAKALMAAGRRDEAADHLLDLIGRDREWNEGAARQKFLALLEASGLEDPWSGAQRRRLSAVLFT